MNVAHALGTTKAHSATGDAKISRFLEGRDVGFHLCPSTGESDKPRHHLPSRKCMLIVVVRSLKKIQKSKQSFGGERN